MADNLRPELPRSSAAIAEPTHYDPDSRGHFGAYGGRLVAEALMAVIEEVTAAYEKVRTDQAYLDEQDLIVPHPRMHERAFVLVPLAEIDPSFESARDALPEEALATVKRL